MFNFKISIFICFYLFTSINSIEQSGFNCRQATNCSACIATANECKWCKDDEYPAKKPRCQAHFQSGECLDIFEPLVQKDSTKNKAFSSDTRDPVQLRPQQTEVSARVGFTNDVLIEYKQAADYPMDLYYLMDMSYTMKQHQKNVSLVGKKLAEKMKRTTKDFRIGFGTFVDKEAIPYANYDMGPRKAKNETIKYTHSFINYMKLDSNAKEFEEKVTNADVSGNLDSPEGTLDALMQVMVCDKEIGWRPQSDKIIVVATDEEFHYAGDGKIGGIIIPNDGQCHLKNNHYEDSTIYDYPSMHHIAEVAQRLKFNIVFSVAKNVTTTYQVLTDIIGSNARVAQLTSRDNSIPNMIEEVYKNISTSVNIEVEQKPENVDVQILSNCGNINGKLLPVNTCNFQGKAVIPFHIRIKLLKCMSPGENINHLVRIGLLNKNEAVEVVFKEQCKCACEDEGETDSHRCSFNGTYACGICYCNGRRSGAECECDPEKPIDLRNPNAHCIKSGETLQCSGHGECECAKCKCDLKWTGEYCEVDESECYHWANGRQVKCNNQGDCVNNQCVCNKFFEGKYCDCTTSNATCIDQNHTICYGRGDCRCGRCECTRQATAHGKYCEKCPLCEAPQFCEQILSCIPEFSNKFCLKDVPSLPWTAEMNSTIVSLETNVAFAKLESKVGSPSNETNPCSVHPEDCPAITSRWKVKIMDDEESGKSKPIEEHQHEMPNLQKDVEHFFNFQCLKVINGCAVSYSFKLNFNPDIFNDDGVERDEKETMNFEITLFKEICPQPVNMVLVGSSTLFAVLFIGLLTICIWKLLTNYLDRKEYERFIMEVDAANFSESENPLYKDAKVQFRNPAFGLRDRTSRFFNFKK